MYLEVKALFSSVAMIFIAMVLAHLIMVDLFLTFLLLVAIVLVLMGDMFFGYKVVISDVKPIMEPTPKGKELMSCSI